MAEKPTIQIVLPVMPNPKDFKGLGINSTSDAGLFQMALTAWENVCRAAIPEAPVTPINDGTKH